MKKGRSVPLEPMLLDKLRDVEFAATFLTNSFDSNSDEDFEAFFDALELIVKAAGVSNVSDKMGASRDTIYKVFKTQNPTVKTLRSVLRCLDLELAVVPRKKA